MVWRPTRGRYCGQLALRVDGLQVAHRWRTSTRGASRPHWPKSGSRLLTPLGALPLPALAGFAARLVRRRLGDVLEELAQGALAQAAGGALDRALRRLTAR